MVLATLPVASVAVAVPSEAPSASSPLADPPAAPEASPAPALADAVLAEVGATAEVARSSVQELAVWMARGVDSWFGDKPFEEGGRVSNGQLSLGLLKRQRETPQFDARFNARFKLPNIEQHTYLFIGRDDPREVLNDKPAAFSRQEQLLPESNADRTFFAGFGRSLTDAIDFRLGLRNGLKPYAQVRYRAQWLPSAQDLVEFRQTVFYAAYEHAGLTSVVSLDHAWSPTLATRWLNSATASQTSHGVDWSSLLGSYRSFGGQRVLSLEGIVNGQQSSGVGVNDYGLQTRWEQPIYQDWLLGGLVIGHFWPRPDLQTERRPAWALGFSLRMHL